MNCIMNINRYIIPNDVICTLTNIYKYVGKNQSYDKVVGSDLGRIVSQTIERDSYFLSKILKLDLSDTRMRLIITKDSSPRTKEEKTLYSIKEVLASFQFKYNEIGTQTNDLLNLVNYIFPSENIKYNYMNQNKKNPSMIISNDKSKRMILEEMIEEINNHLNKHTFEPIILSLQYFIDLYNLQPFSDHNYIMALLILYLYLLKLDIHTFKYISFFELLFNCYNEFEEELNNASFNWNEGYPQTTDFIRFMTKQILTAYKKTDDLIDGYAYDSNINKSDNIEITISKLPSIFTKDEIRIYHPYISESTINRTLCKLREDKKIRPLGKGRSAKWIKI